MLDQATLVFIEVRYRSSTGTAGAENITVRKMCWQHSALEQHMQWQDHMPL